MHEQYHRPSDAPLMPRTKDMMQCFSRLLNQHLKRIEGVLDRTNNDLAAIATHVEQLERAPPPAAALLLSALRNRAVTHPLLAHWPMR